MPALIVGLTVLSCKNNTATVAEKPVEVPVIAVQSRSLALEQLYVSDIKAIRNVELRSRISGFLEGMYVDEGQTVKKGQLLFKISAGEYAAEVSKAKAVLNNMKAEAKVTELECARVKQLVEKNIISQTELELAASKLNAAKAKTEEAESALKNAVNRLSYTSIIAPFDGVVDRIPLKAGSLVNEGTLITSVSDNSTMYAYFNVSENEYLDFTRGDAGSDMKEGRPACLVLADGGDYDCKGKIETVVSEFDQSTGSISFRASFPNPNHLLKHGATGKVKLATKVNQAIIIPQKASFEIQDKNYVYILDASNVIRMKSFNPSARVDQYYVVSSGLSKGDRIVYEGIQNLREGMKVIPRTVSPDSLPAITALLP